MARATLRHHRTNFDAEQLPTRAKCLGALHIAINFRPQTRLLYRHHERHAKHVARQRPLQFPGFIPRRPHPDAQVICPSGKSPPARKNLSSPRAKNISLFPKPKSVVCSQPSRLDQRGVRVVTDVGCGMRWTLWRRKTSGAIADGEDVWSWRPDAGAKVCGGHLRNDGGKRARSPGRARNKP
jgi:hypothetical protein